MEREFAFRNGMEVFGSDGGKVGKIVEIDPNYIVVEKGFFFPSDHFIPRSAVGTVGEDEKVYLNVTKDAALNQGWETPPEPMVDDREVTATGAGPTTAGYDTTSDSSLDEFVTGQPARSTADPMMPEAENPTSYAGDPAYRDTAEEDRVVRMPVTEERASTDRAVQARERAAARLERAERDLRRAGRDADDMGQEGQR